MIDLNKKCCQSKPVYHKTQYLNGVARLMILCICVLSCEQRKTDEHTLSNTEVEAVNDGEKENVFPDNVSKHIYVVPSMEAEFRDRNTVHCSNIGYLWNRMMSKTDRRIEDNLLAKDLNKSLTWQNSMDSSKLILALGRPDDVYANVIHQYKSKYGIEKNDLVPVGDSFWGYTDKLINYKYAEPFDEQKLMFLGTEVEAFGFSSGFGTSNIKDYLKDQFDILYYSEQGEFVVKLNPANTTDEIVLVMLSNRSNFSDMFNTTRQLIKTGKEATKKDPWVYNLNSDDELLIPAIRFKALRKYTELQGVKFSSAFGAIGLMEQVINFNFDRKGVVMESMMEVVDSVSIPPKPKLLHFYKPFYLFIKEANAPYPYFNLWVSDVSILERKKRVGERNGRLSN